VSLGGFVFFARGLQFGFLPFFLGLDAVIFAATGSLKVVAGGVESVTEARFGRERFGLGQSGAFQQP
jgi:hypothetical protein